LIQVNTLVKQGEGYVLTQKISHIYIFNEKGYLIEIKDRNDNKVKIEVDDKEKYKMCQMEQEESLLFIIMDKG